MAGSTAGSLRKSQDVGMPMGWLADSGHQRYQRVAADAGDANPPRLNPRPTSSMLVGVVMRTHIGTQVSSDHGMPTNHLQPIESARHFAAQVPAEHGS